MTTSRNPTWAPAVYRATCKVTRQSPTSFLVITNPPIHSATVFKADRQAHWLVDYPTFDRVPPRHTYESESKALNAAAEVIGRRAGEDWRTRFNGAQRTAIGHQKCPRIMSGGRPCEQPAAPATIWCEWHPKGKDKE